MTPSSGIIVRVALIAIILSCPAVVSAATRVFYDDFESGNTNLWSQDDYRNLCQVVTVAADSGAGPASGSKMLRCNWDGSAAWNDPASYETLRLSAWDANNELFLRFWLRPDDNAKDHPANGPKIWRLAASNDMSFWAMNFRDGIANGAMYNSLGNQIGSTYWGGASNLSNGAWHEFEMYIKQGSTDGIIRYWEDGVMQYEALNANTTQSGGTWAPLYISSNWSGAPGCCDHDAVNYLYWDHFEIFSDVTSGDPTSGLMSDGSIQVTSSDTTPPAAPTGLVIE